jgi:hypothetical protein
MRRKDGDVKLGVFPVSVGVEVAPRGSDFPGNVLSRAPRSPLEEKMLHEMGNPVDFGQLETRPCPDPEVHGDRSRSGVLDPNRAQPVGKRFLGNPSPAWGGDQETEKKKSKKETVTGKHFSNS